MFFELLGAKVQNNCEIAMRGMPIIPEMPIMPIIPEMPIMPIIPVMPIIPEIPVINFAKGASRTGSRSTTGSNGVLGRFRLVGQK